MHLRSLGGLTSALAATGIFMSLALPARAATAREAFEQKLGKSAQLAENLPGKPKGTCVCMSNLVPAIAGEAGMLRLFSNVGSDGRTRVMVDCLVPGFDESGVITSLRSCSDYVPLPK